jgi:EAL domain-containing protein (putative c-di-GMP-specific phosphodiesterase class I)/GGDEF domain-containing protein
MSMFRQLWLAILVSTLMALTGSLLISMLSARSYLESQLSIKNSDNATALALSLSQSKPDGVMIELVVASLFDSGHYESVKVVDPQGLIMAERVTTDIDLGAPGWFANLLPIRAQAGQAQISSGWKQLGVVTLVSQSRFAYAALWKSAQEMAFALVLAGLAGGVMSTLVLRRLRRPLNAVIDQAQAITERRFVTMDEPAVPELKKLAQAMNATVARLRSMFDDEAMRLEGVRREANCDPLTGLANRSNFLARLKDTVQAEDSSGGAVFIARVANLAAINQTLGRHATDELLRAFGRGIQSVGAKYPEALAARLNGADFALLIPALRSPGEVAGNLLQVLTDEAGAFVPDQATTWLGCGYFPRGLELEPILAQVDLALAAVEAQGVSGFKVADMYLGDDAPKSADEWARLIKLALNQKWVRLVSFPVVSLDGALIHRECPLRLMFDEQGEWQPAGKFLPVAERLRLTPALDLVAVGLGLDELEAKPLLKGLAINLSASSVQSVEFRADLQKLLKRRSGTQRLWLEVAESGALAHFDAFVSLCADLRAVGCKVGLEHFGRQFSEVGKLHGLGLDYLKVDGSFIRGLDSNPGNQAFLKGLSTIAHGIGLSVIAEGVTQNADLAVLRQIGFDGATGPGVQDPPGGLD